LEALKTGLFLLFFCQIVYFTIAYYTVMCYNIYILYRKGDAMRLQISKTKNAASFYVVKSVYTNGKRTNKVVEKLGTYEELRLKLGNRDPHK